MHIRYCIIFKYNLYNEFYYYKSIKWIMLPDENNMNNSIAIS